MKTHTELLNYIAAKINARSYLEIGVSNGKNFNQIAAVHKVGIDPDLTSMATIHKTSNDFFDHNKETFDLIFIDGLHEAEQVHKDIINAHQCLTEKGIIVIHDCNPAKESISKYPRDSKEWCGTVYQAVSQIDSPKITADMDYGCMIITKKDPIIFDTIIPYCNWNMFNEARKEYLNLVSVNEAISIIDSW